MRPVHAVAPLHRRKISRSILGGLLVILTLVASVTSAQERPQPAQRDRTTPVLQGGAAFGMGALGMGVAAAFGFGVLAASGLDEEGFHASYVAGGVVATALVPVLSGAGATRVGRRRGGHGTYRASVFGSLVVGVATTGVMLATALTLRLSDGSNAAEQMLFALSPVVGVVGATVGAVMGYRWSDQHAQAITRWVPSPTASATGAALAWSGKF